MHLRQFKALLSAIRDKFDADPNVASLSFLETSTGANFGAGGYAPALEGLFLNGVVQMERDAGCLFKHTPLFQNLNYPRNKLADFVTNLTSYGVGLGGPDVFTDALKTDSSGYCTNGLGYNKPGQPKGVYRYYPEVAPTLPIGQQVHNENFEYTPWEKMKAGQSNGLTPAQAVSSVFNFSKDKLLPNYMFWQVGGYSTHATALKARWASSDPAQRLPLRTGCPSVYGGTCSSP